VKHLIVIDMFHKLSSQKYMITVSYKYEATAQTVFKHLY